ncbi:hypothetical protein GCM10009675_21380 [Prauserella alba]|uniref:Secreted protein n=1 Tax=Prauserella alba TaxID=176898 RepID=A0ABN1VDF5_9PSEU
MVAAVAVAAVVVPPAVVARQQVVEGGEQVVVTARAGFQDRQPGRRVRYPHVQQTVPGPVRHVREETFSLARQIGHHRTAAGADLDLGGVHAPTVRSVGWIRGDDHRQASASTSPRHDTQDVIFVTTWSMMVIDRFLGRGGRARWQDR